MSQPDQRMRFFLAFVLLVLVVHLGFGDHPWEEGIARRNAEGKPIRPVDYWVSYGYWVAAAVAAVVALLLATLRRWFDAAAAPERLATLPAVGVPGRAWIAALAGAALVGGLLGAPRLGHSLWTDEHYSVARSIHGSYVVEDGELEFEEVKLRNTAWEYRKPNNHVFHSLLARASIGAWEAVTRPDDRSPPEAVIRVPALLGGLTSIVSVALLGWLLGMPRAALLAAWLLALHPWHVRYLSEARGYSIAMALVSGTTIAMILALQRGTWLRWSVYGVVQLLLLWTYPGAVYHVLLVNLVALGALLRFDRGTEHLRSQLTRFVFVNLSGALFWVLMMTPNIVQLLAYLDTGGQDPRVLRWLQEYGSHLVAGMQWSHRGGGEAFHVALDQSAPWLRLLWIGLGSVALGLGVLRFLRAGGLRAALVPVFLLAAPLFVAQSLLRGDLLYPWYAIFFLPMAALLVGAGVGWLAERSGRPGPASVALGALMLAVMLALSWPMHVMQRKLPIYPDRESVAATRPFDDLESPEHDRIITVNWSDLASGYDPWMHDVDSPDELRGELRAADASGRALFVNLGRIDLWEKRRPELMALVANPALFERVWAGHGSDPKGNRVVWRYRPGTEERHWGPSTASASDR